MKRISVAAAIAAILAGTTLTLGQGRGNPFVDLSDSGEKIHVLPPAAALHNPNANNPTDAPPHFGYAVYGASYGSGNLINHGGPVMGNATFQAVYWNSSLATKIQSGIDGFVSSFSDNLVYSNSDHSADYTIVQQYINAYLLTPRTSYVDTQHDGKRVPGSFSDSSVRNYLASLFANGSLSPDGDTVFGMY